MNRLLTIAFAFAVVCATGCQLPTRQLEDYRRAFIQARDAGEEVLLDYGAARETYEEHLAERGLSDEEAPDARTRLAFDPDEIAEAPADAVGVNIADIDERTRQYERFVENMRSLVRAMSADALVGGVLKLTEVIEAAKPLLGDEQA